MRKKSEDCLCGRGVYPGEGTELKLRRTRFLAERLGSPGEAELYLPDSLAAPSPDGVVCEGWGSSQREFHAFHLLHFDVEGVRCSGIFLPCRVAPQCWHSFEDKAPSCEGWTLQKVFFCLYIKCTENS